MESRGLWATTGMVGTMALVGFLLIWGIGLVVADDTSEPYFREGTEAVPEGHTRLGVAFPAAQNEAELARSVAAMRDLGLSRVRLGCEWAHRERAEGVYYWDPFAARLRAFNEAGISVLLTLESHSWPAWLPRDDPEHDAPEALGAFRNYARELLDLFGDGIALIQFGNEWNWEIDTYFGGSEAAYIAYSNILADEVLRYRSTAGSETPALALGSFSARQALAYDQGLISEIRMEGRPVLEREIENYSRRPPAERITPRVMNILSKTRYEVLDIHLYDDYEAWELYLRAYLSAFRKARGETAIPVIASEYGGPYPKNLYPLFGVPDGTLLASRIPDYVRALNSLGLAEAYFFKLQEGGRDIQHPDSFLLFRSGAKAPAYEAMKRMASE